MLVSKSKQHRLCRSVSASPRTDKIIESFSTPQIAYKAKSTFELFRAKLVFTVCGCKWIVDKSEIMLATSNKILGQTITNSILKATFFGHFCAGEDEKSIKPTVEALQSCGVGSILDYAAEADVTQEQPKVIVTDEEVVDPNKFTARTFEYQGEEQCDANMIIFFSCISSVQAVSPEGFAAIKITALGQPEILERISDALTQTKNFFKNLDLNLDGSVSFSEWKSTFDQFETPDGEISELFRKVSRGKDTFDYVSWSSACKLEDIWKVFTMIEKIYGKKMIENGLNEKELALMKNMINRVHKIADFAAEKNVRLMVDAEQTYFQPAINHLVHLLQLKHNRVKPIIFHTYQCYLVDSMQRVAKDIERAKREEYFFAAKVVRGAYIVSERARAEQRGYTDPIFSTIEDTHQNYHAIIELILSQVKNPSLLIASHNQQSIEFVVRKMEELNIDPALGNIYFGQLLGMADHLTFSLGYNSYKAYKYVPYGPVHEVPYLIRRAHENSNLLAGSNTLKELDLITSELKRRKVMIVFYEEISDTSRITMRVSNLFTLTF